MSGHALNGRSGRASHAHRDRGRGRPHHGAGRWRLPILLPTLAAAVALLAGCSGTRTGPPNAPKATASPTAISPTSDSNDNVLRLVVPPGPVQNGNIASDADWVTPFENQTGCRVELKNANTDAQAFTLLTQGTGDSYYDGILASPEVAGQLINDRAAAPLDTSRITGYPELSARLRDTSVEVSGGTVYGVPYLWDSYVTGYDVGKVNPAPQGWSAVFAPSSAAKYAGKITVPDSPATLALAALYLKSAQPSLGISDPFELTKPQLAAAAQAVSAIHSSVGTFWSQDSSVIGQLGDGQDVLGAVMTHQIVQLARAGLPTAGVPAPATAAGAGTTIGWVYSWLMSAHAPNTTCTYKWLSWSASRYVQEHAAVWSNVAPAAPSACRGATAALCSEFHEADLATARNLIFEHLPVKDCGNGQTGCTDYAQWQAAWQHITGPTDGPSGQPTGG